ncbi:MAG: GGDEF domain-containing protein [Treponema sp.]|nr:GGDEF domain-containing protein [Treponema sp.]
MKKLLYFFIKNNTLPIYIVTCAAFLAWTFIALTFTGAEFYHLRFVNTGCTLVLLLLCLLYKKMNRITALTVFLIVTLLYCILLPVIVNMNCGTEFYLLSSIPALFLLTADYKKPRGYYTILNILIFFALLFLLCYRITHTPPTKLFIAERRLFYMMSQYTAIGLSITFMTYSGFNSLVILHHLSHKSKFLQKELEYTAKHDALTSLMNRRRTAEIFAECEQRKEADNTDFAICIFDIDNFKKINDTYGHDAGDFILKSYSSAVRKAFHESIKVARWGGEEFLIIFPAITQNTIYELERIRKRIAATPIEYNGKPITVTATYGISSSRNIHSAGEVLADADHMLLEGKDNGKNRLVVSEKY